MQKTLSHSNNFFRRIIASLISLSCTYQIALAQPGHLTSSDLAKLSRKTVRDDNGFVCGFVNLTDSSFYDCNLNYLGKIPKDAIIIDGETCCLETKICAMAAFPSIHFKTGSLSLTPTTQAILNFVVGQMNANPGCNVRITGYYSASSKRTTQSAWDRVNCVIKYLSEKQGISETRLIWNFGSNGDPNSVDFEGTNETGPTSVPAPFPNYNNH